MASNPMFPKPPAAPSRKPEIPDYELLRCIGYGAHGEVWLARGIARTYRAVKVIYRSRFDNARPFERELAGIRAFDPISRGHEGLVDVLHVGQNDAEGFFYYVMELADDVSTGQEINPETYQARTLDSVVSKGAPLPFPEALELGISLTKALAYLHGRALVHRDIKPSNIIYVNGTPKFADIGSVTELVRKGSDHRSFDGTLGFMAPEGPGTAQADIFSLGRVLYEVSLGRDRTRFPTIPMSVCDWPHAEQLNELNQVILKACQNNPGKRYQSAEEMYHDLSSLVDGRTMRRLRALERRLKRVRRTAIAAGIAAVVVGLLAFEFVRETNRQAEAQSRDVGAQVALGIDKITSWEMVQALPHLLQALQRDGSEKNVLHRIRIAALLDQCPRLAQFWSMEHEATDAQFSSDGKLVVIATRDGQVQVKDAQSGTNLAAPFGPKSLVESACFSADNRLVLVASQDFSVTLWEWQSGTRLLKLPHTNGVFSAKFDHKGERIVTSCSDKLARIFDAETGVLLVTLAGHTDRVRYAAFSSDDQFVITASDDRRAILWRATDGEPVHTFPHKSWVLHASFSPDGKRVATACADHEGHIWEIESEREIMPRLHHGDGLSSIEFSPDGALLMTASWDTTVRLWEAASGRPLAPNHTLPHSGRVLSAAFAPDGHRIITSCFDGTSRIWDLAGMMTTPQVLEGSLGDGGTRLLVRNGNVLEVIDPSLIAKADLSPGTEIETPHLARITPDDPVANAALAGNGKFVLTLTCPANHPKGNDTLTLWNSETAEKIVSWPHFSNRLDHVRVSDDGRQAVVWAARTATVYDLASLHPILTPLVHRHTIAKAIFSPNGHELLTLSGTEAQLFELPSGRPKFPVLNHPKPLRHAEFSRDGKLLVTTCSDDYFTPCSAQVWNAINGQPVGAPISHGDGVVYATFSFDGRQIVSSSEDFSAIISDTGGGELRQIRHNNQIGKVSFSPNGNWVLSVSRDQSARVWEAHTGEPITPPLPHFEEVVNGVFIDNSFIVTTDKKGRSRLWQLRTDNHSLAELQILVRLLNGGLREPGGSTATAQSKLVSEWQAMKNHYPEEFNPSTVQVIAWHQRQLSNAQQESNAEGIAFHLKQIRALQSNDTIQAVAAKIEVSRD